MTDSQPTDHQALTQGGHPSLTQAASYLRRQQAQLASRFGIRLASVGPDTTPLPAEGTQAAPIRKPAGDFGGGERGQPIVPAGPTMNDALRRILRADRGY